MENPATGFAHKKVRVDKMLQDINTFQLRFSLPCIHFYSRMSRFYNTLAFFFFFHPYCLKFVRQYSSTPLYVTVPIVGQFFFSRRLERPCLLFLITQLADLICTMNTSVGNFYPWWVSQNSALYLSLCLQGAWYK